MPRNKKSYALLVTVLCCIAVTIPSIIFRAILLEGNGVEEDDESSFLMTPLTIEPEESFPEDYFSFIHKIDFIEGDNYTTNNLTELKSLDGNKYEIMGDIGIGGYYFNLNFYYNVTNFNYPNPSFIDFYDFYLYLQIDSSAYSQIIYLQGYNGTDWYNITEISNEEINFNRYLVNNTTEIRIYGFTLSQKIITIERFCILLTHNDIFPFAIDLENIEMYDISHSETMGVSKYSNLYFPYTEFDINNEDWWKYDTESSRIWQQSSGTFDLVDFGYGWIDTDAVVDMKVNKTPYFTKDYEVQDAKVKIRHNWLIDMPPSYIIDYYVRGWIWNFETETWEFLKQTTNYGQEFVTFDWTSNLDAVPDISDYIDPITFTWRFRIKHYIRFSRGTTFGICALYTKIYYSKFNFTSDYSYYSFPQIEAIYTSPPSPLSTLEQFRVKTDVDSQISSIQKVEYYIKNHSTEWNPMSYDTGDTWQCAELDIKDFPNGDYIVWINASDEQNYNTLKYYQFTVFNALPEINYITPLSEGEEITQLYNYNINVSVTDFEDDPYEVPQISIINDELDVILDWTTMERFNILNPHYWNYSINPINLENGLYTIAVKTNDSKEIEVLNSITINVINNPPQIEIIEPSLTELITPLEQKIICNVTNEEVINSVQWDLVTELDNFEWKPLIYNITSEFYETNYSLLEYEYSDTYYLVVNATDDKYNSSLKIKPLQLHPLLTYHINKTEITYNNKGIIVHPNSAYTTDILASFEIDHHPIAKERDFEIYLPSQFDDANHYYINRGFEKFTPVGFYISGTYTEWYIPYYQTQDTVYCNLEKPKIINKLVEEKGDETLRLEFSLSSKYSFSAITINNQFSKYFSNPENFDYRLYYQFEGDWIEFDEDDFEIDPDSFPSVEFVWDSIEEGGVIYFRFDAIPLEVEGENLIPYIIFGGVIGLIPEIPFILFTYRKRYKKREAGGWGKGRYLLIVLGLYVAGFIGGYILGWLWFQIF